MPTAPDAVGYALSLAAISFAALIVFAIAAEVRSWRRADPLDDRPAIEDFLDQVERLVDGIEQQRGDCPTCGRRAWHDDRCPVLAVKRYRPIIRTIIRDEIDQAAR